MEKTKIHDHKRGKESAQEDEATDNDPFNDCYENRAEAEPENVRSVG
jgi:hypothetical protein